MNTSTWTIQLGETEFDVEVEVDGRYRPATPTSPAEWPDLIVVSVTSNDELVDLLRDDIVDRLAKEVAADLKEEAA